MAVAYDAGSESHTGTTGSVSEASFSWSHTPVGTPRGAIVFVFNNNTTTDNASAVTYGGTAMSLVSGGAAVDTAGEAAYVETYFLGSSVPTGAQTVQVTRTNNAFSLWAVCATVTAANNTEVYTPGIVLLQEDGLFTEQNVDDGSPGASSLRFAAAHSGTAAVSNLALGANTSAIHDIDWGNSIMRVGYETTPGQGSRPVGFSFGTSDDRAAVHLAVREIIAGGGAPKKKIMNVYRQYRS